METNPRDWPHLIISGGPSHKTEFLCDLLLALSDSYKEDRLKLHLIDPILMEFSDFESLPHLVGPIAWAPKHFQVTLERLNNLLEQRKNLQKEECLILHVLVVGELADLMLTKKNGIWENLLSRLLEEGHHYGIHLVLGTQRPSKDVLTRKMLDTKASQIKL